MTFGLAGINEPERAYLTIPFFCDEVDNDTINDFLLTLTTQLTLSSIIGEKDWSKLYQYYAIRYTNNDFNADPNDSEYQILKHIINGWVCVSYIIAIIGINTIICIPKFRQKVGKFLYDWDKRVSSLLSNFLTEPTCNEYDNHFFSFLQGMVFPIMSAAFIYILVHDIKNLDNYAWNEHVSPIPFGIISLCLVVPSAIISTLWLSNQISISEQPNSVNISIILIFLLFVVCGVYFMILHSFWLTIALLAYPGQTLITCLYIIPISIIIAVVWNIFLEIIDTSMTLICYVNLSHLCTCCLCCKKKNRRHMYNSITGDDDHDLSLNMNKDGLAFDLFVLIVILASIGLFWGFLIYIVFELIQFIHLRVEIDFGIFASLVANAVLLLIAGVLLIVNFIIIGLFKRKFNATPEPFTMPLIYKLKNIDRGKLYNTYKNFKIHLCWILCCRRYIKRPILLKLQHVVKKTLADIIKKEPRENFGYQNIKNKFIKRVLSRNLINIPFEMIVTKVYDGIQQACAIEENAQLFNQHQQALQEAFKGELQSLLTDGYLDPEKLEQFINRPENLN
jgi:hypothetical protein